MSDGLSTSKRCSACREQKDLSLFGRKMNSPDGLAYTCKACFAAMRRVDRKARPEAYREAEVRRWARNSEKRSALAKRWYAANREYAIAKALEWSARNPGKRLHSSLLTQRARRRAMPTWVNRVAIDAIYEEARMMTSLHGVPFEVDHVVPLRGKHVCGLHVPWNLQILTDVANRAKSNRLEAYHE